jgi:pimeloyl-ACP methyl ester carboxylesterase
MKTNTGIFKKMITPVAIFFLIAIQSFGQANQNNKTKIDSGYAPVNGLKMYYEIYGEGAPLVLIHGGVGAIEMFGANLTALAQTHKVIAVDLQAHGRTADIDRPLKCELMADDIAALLKYLKIDRAEIMGYSLGGEVALRTAIQHPEMVNKIVVVSATFKRDGWYPEILAGMSQMGPAAAEPMKQTPMYQMYAQIAPRVQDWPVLITKLGDLLKQDYDWSEEVKKIRTPTLIVAGDADAVRTSHAVEFFALLGGGQRDGGWDGSGRPKNCELAILPGLTHYTIFNAPALASTAIQFLDAKN